MDATRVRPSQERSSPSKCTNRKKRPSIKKQKMSPPQKLRPYCNTSAEGGRGGGGQRQIIEGCRQINSSVSHFCIRNWPPGGATYHCRSQVTQRCSALRTDVKTQMQKWGLAMQMFFPGKNVRATKMFEKN